MQTVLTGCTLNIHVLKVFNTWMFNVHPVPWTVHLQHIHRGFCTMCSPAPSYLFTSKNNCFKKTFFQFIIQLFYLYFADIKNKILMKKIQCDRKGKTCSFSSFFERLCWYYSINFVQYDIRNERINGKGKVS